mmetsp:Transcript_21129/g.23427  ORF Transcript_21129/g.23427 Transcript_21129/m.23427 type:complete len:111 (+) Transcript_21129:448-780(+)
MQSDWKGWPGCNKNKTRNNSVSKTIPPTATPINNGSPYVSYKACQGIPRLAPCSSKDKKIVFTMVPSIQSISNFQREAKAYTTTICPRKAWSHPILWKEEEEEEEDEQLQ